MKLIASLTALSIALMGCASSSQNIATASVSPFQYANFSCDMIAMEMNRVNSRASELGGRLDTAAKNDQALMAVTLLLFWPAAFALGGNKAQEAEYARLKGEAEALHQAGVQKGLSHHACRSDRHVGSCGSHGTGPEPERGDHPDPGEVSSKVPARGPSLKDSTCLSAQSLLLKRGEGQSG